MPYSGRLHQINAPESYRLLSMPRLLACYQWALPKIHPRCIKSFLPAKLPYTFRIPLAKFAR